MADRPCHPLITRAGLPHREEVILERERNLFPLMVDRLLGRGKTSREHPSNGPTMAALEETFARREPTTLRAAAFLAGRCQPDEPEDRERLTALLRGLLEALPVKALDIMAAAYIEAAMSLGLRGDAEAARLALRPLVAGDASGFAQAYLAAFYLAQLGDPAGYPALLEALRSANEHNRLMAVRHLVAFKPYDGQAVQGVVVDIRAELVKRLQDHDAYVRAEVPYLLKEAEVGGLQDLLLPIAESDSDNDVREAARAVLSRLPKE